MDETVETDSKERYNIVLAGKYGVGKTAIFKVIKTGGLSTSSEQQHQQHQSTDGTASAAATASPPGSSNPQMELEHQLYTAVLDGVNYQVNIWDTGGLEKFRSMTSSYFRNTMAIILVYDTRPERMETLFNLEEWIREARERSAFKERLILSLWGNTCHDDQSRTDSVEQTEVVTAFKQEHGIPDSLHFKVSTKTNTNIVSSLHSLIKFIYKCNNTDSTESVDASADHSSSSRSRTCFKC